MKNNDLNVFHAVPFLLQNMGSVYLIFLIFCVRFFCFFFIVFVLCIVPNVPSGCVTRLSSLDYLVCFIDDCVDVHDIRWTFYTVNSLSCLFVNVICFVLNEIDLRGKIYRLVCLLFQSLVLFYHFNLTFYLLILLL